MKGRGKEIALGLLLLVAAGLIIAAQMGFNVILAGFGWFEIIVLVVCVWAFITGLIEMEFFKLLFGLGIGYVVISKPLGWPEVSVWIMLVAILVAGSGLSMIFRRKKRISISIGDDENTHYYHYDADDKMYSGMDRETESEESPRSGERRNAQDVVFSHKTFYTGDAQYIGGDVIFSGVNKYIEGQDVRKISTDVVFSTLRLYFDKAQLSNGTAEVRSDVVFGSLYVYVPREWNVVDETGRIFSRPHTDYAEVLKPGAPTLYIKGDCVFGNVIIKRI